MKNYDMDIVKVEQVIICTNKRQGKGINSDPIRIITQVFSFDGELIAEHDPFKDQEFIETQCGKIPVNG